MTTKLRKATEAMMTGIDRDLQDATGLTGSDFAVLSRLVDLGGGELRQKDLAASIGWDKSRLSHHLTRMEERALLARHATNR